MRMVFSISASRISCSGSAAASCGSTGPSRSKSTHSKGMGGLRKGLFSPFITIPSNLIRARLEENKSELQSLMCISYPVHCLNKNKESQCTSLYKQQLL